MYKILYDFGSLQLDPKYIVMIVASLLLLALAQSYASAKKMRLGPATVLSLAILIIGDGIVYFAFDALFRAQYPASYVFQHVSIYSYGFMLMVAFVVGTIWLIVQGKREKPRIEADTILDLMVFIIIGSIIGARLVYVFTQPQQYSGQPWEALRITEGGLSIHGGVLGAMVFGWIYVKAKRLDYWKMVDFAIPGVPLGIFIGRIGCFLNGCCHGIRCDRDFPLGVVFPNAATWQERGFAPDLAQLYDAGQAAIGQYMRHPAQLYEALGALLVFWYLINFRHNKAFKGHVFLMFVWLYSVLRFVVEFYRHGDPDTGEGSSVILWHTITMAQLACLILGFVAIVLIGDLRRRALLAKMLAEGEEVEAVAEEEEEEIEEKEEDEEEVPEGEGLPDEEGGEEGTEGAEERSDEPLIDV